MKEKGLDKPGQFFINSLSQNSDHLPLDFLKIIIIDITFKVYIRYVYLLTIVATYNKVVFVGFKLMPLRKVNYIAVLD